MTSKDRHLFAGGFKGEFDSLMILRVEMGLKGLQDVGAFIPYVENVVMFLFQCLGLAWALLDHIRFNMIDKKNCITHSCWCAPGCAHGRTTATCSLLHQSRSHL